MFGVRGGGKTNLILLIVLIDFFPYEFINVSDYIEHTEKKKGNMFDSL